MGAAQCERPTGTADVSTCNLLSGHLRSGVHWLRRNSNHSIPDRQEPRQCLQSCTLIPSQTQAHTHMKYTHTQQHDYCSCTSTHTLVRELAHKKAYTHTHTSCAKTHSLSLHTPCTTLSITVLLSGVHLEVDWRCRLLAGIDNSPHVLALQ
jgi:pyruvate dehydrogenase complex dehydrogenase (E1) component